MKHRLLSVLLLLTLALLQPAPSATEPTPLSELQPAPEGTFSIAVLPDTQRYHGRGTKAEPDSTDEVTNATFDAYTQWIAGNIAAQRIAFVTHVGDIVDINTAAQWDVARRCMDRLHGKVPYGISPGNHDMTGEGDSSLFQKYFPQSRFEEFPWYGGAFQSPGEKQTISGNNANSYQLFSAEGYDFVILHLECNAPDDVLAWANAVLEEHASRRAIVTTHMFLGPAELPKVPADYYDAPKDRMRWTKRHGGRGNNAEDMWDECFSMHKNLFMIICGDQSRSQAMLQTAVGRNGNVVHAVLSDYGYEGFRVYRFVPKENIIYVQTVNPLKGVFCEGTDFVPDVRQHQFILSYDMGE
jgi:Calcineurin-like phosphoesterase